MDVSSRFEFRVIRRSGSGSDSSRSEFRVTLRSIVSDGITSKKCTVEMKKNFCSLPGGASVLVGK